MKPVYFEDKDGTLYYLKDGIYIPIQFPNTVIASGGGSVRRGPQGAQGAQGASGSGNVVTDITLQGNGSNASPLGLPYKTYIGQFSDEGGVSVLVLENTIGNIVWTKPNTGSYVGNLTGAFPLNKSVITISQGIAIGIVGCAITDVDNVSVQTFSDLSGTNADYTIPAQAGSLFIEIRVYP